MDAVANFAYSTVSTAPSPATTGTSMVVASGTVFPAVPFNAVVWPAGASPLSTNAEIVRVTANSSGTLTITRKQEGTSARTVEKGDQIMAAITAKTLTDLEGFKEESLKATTAKTKLDLSKATVFRVTLEVATTEFEVINAPTTHAAELTLITTQDATGGRKMTWKGVSWVGGAEPTSLVTTAGTRYLFSFFTTNAGTEILGVPPGEGTGLTPNSVITEYLANEAVTSAKIAEGTIKTVDLENKSINRAKFISEISKLIPLERGRSEFTGVTEGTIPAPNTFSGVTIIISLEGTGTPVACEIKERKSGESFVVKFASAFTGAVNWVVYE